MRTIKVVPYHPQWPDRYLHEEARIKALLGDVVKEIHHIGSTAVPGLAAKPVIDILLAVSGLRELDECAPAMVRGGYVARGENGIPGRRHFIRGGEQRSHQVHAFAIGDRQIVRHLAFRDYLLTHPDAAAEYAEIKRAAAATSENDIQRYSALKADFITHHLQLALRTGNR